MRELPRLAFVAATWMAIPFSCFSLAEQWINSSLAGMLNGAMPLMTATIAAVLLRRAPGRVQVAGLTIGFAGVVAVMWPALRDGSSSSITGVLLCLLALLCYGFAANVSVPLQQQYGTLPVIFRAQLLALLMTAPFGIVGIGHSSFGWGSLAAVVALGSLGTGVAFVAMGALLVRVGAARASVAIYFVPVVAVIAGVVFRDEHIAALSLVGDGVRRARRGAHEPGRSAAGQRARRLSDAGSSHTRSARQPAAMRPRSVEPQRARRVSRCGAHRLTQRDPDRDEVLHGFQHGDDRARERPVRESRRAVPHIEIAADTVGHEHRVGSRGERDAQGGRVHVHEIRDE